MTIKTFILSSVAAFSTLSLCAQSINVTVDAAGTLATKVNGAKSVKSLSVTGPLNAADFDFICRDMTSLATLDLSSATVAAYAGAPVLGNVTLSQADVLPDYALAGMPVTEVTLPTGLTGIGAAALSGTRIKSIGIPSTVTTIGRAALSNTALTAVSVPASVEHLDSLVFANCKALAKVTYALPQIPAATFLGCSALTDFTATVPVTSIGDRAFMGCSVLETYPFSAALATIGDRAFYGSGLQTVDLSASASLTKVGSWAFADCPALAEVVLPQSITSLGHGALYNDPALTSVTLPQTLTDIPDYFMANATSINDEGIISPETRTIGRYAYKGLESMARLTLPATLGHIGDGAMENWYALTELDAPDLATVPTLGKAVWSGVAQADVTLVVPDDAANDFKGADQWGEFNITNASGDPTGITTVDVDNTHVKAHFEGKTLVLTANQPMSAVTLYNVGGKALSEAHVDGALTLRIDTARWSDNIYVITANLASGLKATFKLTR